MTVEERIQSVRRLAYIKAVAFWKRNKKWATVEDYEAAALVGVWRAAQKFDPAIQPAFEVYASIWMRNAMQRWLMSVLGVAPHPHADMLTMAREHENLGEHYATNAPVFARHVDIDGADTVENLLSRLTPVQRLVLQLRHVQSMTHEEVAKVLGLTTRAGARHHYTRAIAKLKELYSEDTVRS